MAVKGVGVRFGQEVTETCSLKQSVDAPRQTRYLKISRGDDPSPRASRLRGGKREGEVVGMCWG
jgi:hypothetical protein